MQQRCFKFVFPQLGCAIRLLSVHGFSEHILRLGSILLAMLVNKMQSCCQHGLHLLAKDTAIKVHILMKTIFCIKCLHAQQLRESSLVGIFWIRRRETRLLVEAPTMSVARRVVFGSRPPKTASTSKEMNSFLDFHIVFRLFFGSPAP